MEEQEHINEIEAEVQSLRRGRRPLRRRRLLQEIARFSEVVQHVAKDQTEAHCGDRHRDRPRVVRSSVTEKTREVHFNGGGLNPLLRSGSGYPSYHSRAKRAAAAVRRFQRQLGNRSRSPLRSTRAARRRRRR